MYLDPGFGGMLVQAIVLIAAVGGGILFSIRKKISRLFSKDDRELEQVNLKEPDSIDTDEVVDMLDDEKSE